VNLRSHPYESYRASNGEWVDQTPSEWQEQRVKDIFRLVTDKAPVDNDHELLSLYASIGVRPRKDLEARGNKASSTDGYWFVKKGDIVVNKLLAWMGSVGLSEYDGVTSPAYDVLRKTSKLIDVRYFSYLFRTEIAKQIFKRNSRGIMDMRLRLYFDKLGAITVPVPPFSTQQAIATYIDTKTEQIDRQMALLGQKAAQCGKLKQSLISETVNRGLDKSVPLKDSCVEWVGNVPEHWAVKRIKEFSSIVNGATPKSNVAENWNGDLPWVTTDDLGKLSGKFITETKRKLTEIGYASCGTTICPAGSVVISGRAPIGHLGILAIQASTNQGCKTLAINHRRASNLFIFFSLMAAKSKLEALGRGTTFIELSTKELGLFSLAFPPLEEQQVIAAHLDKQTSQMDLIINTINSQIEKLKDLRKALINDVVTGKIKVVSEGKAV
jgi:type I restriction enzyme, S subunit